MSAPIWLRRETLQILHSASIADHGGAEGLRDEGLFESALARPLNLHAYENVEDIPCLAASYAFALAKNHAFVDGSKRIAFIAAAAFLRLNGQRLVAAQADAALTVLRLASGEIGEADFAEWIRRNIKPL